MTNTINYPDFASSFVRRVVNMVDHPVSAADYAFEETIVLNAMSIPHEGRNYLVKLREQNREMHGGVPIPHFNGYNPIQDLEAMGYIQCAVPTSSRALFPAKVHRISLGTGTTACDIFERVKKASSEEFVLPPLNELDVTVFKDDVMTTTVLLEFAQVQYAAAKAEMNALECCQDFRPFFSHYHAICQYAALNKYRSTQHPQFLFCPFCGTERSTSEPMKAAQMKFNELATVVNTLYEQLKAYNKPQENVVWTDPVSS